jgi:8-oxo-dGTP diphosphatase
MSGTSKNFPDSFHRVTIKALVVKDGKILLVKESPERSGMWEIPGGGLDFGEDIHEGLKREVEEEMGLKVKSIEKRPMYVWAWKYQNERNMDWYYSFVVAYKVELESFDFTPTEECEEIGWFSKDELEHIELRHQTNELKKIFNPSDFI